MGFSRHSVQSLGTLAASQERSSSRNCNSSGVRFRSMSQTPSGLLQKKICETRRAELPQIISGAGFCFGRRWHGEALTHRVLTLPIFLADVFFQNFSGAGLGQAIHEFEGARTFIMRQARTAEFD